jgi:hypothetical protein
MSRRGTSRAAKPRKPRCPCGGYFSAWDHDRLRGGETCQYLVDRHKASIEWHEAFSARVRAEMDPEIFKDKDDEVPF